MKRIFSRWLPSHVALVSLAMRFPNFFADGFLTSPLPPPCHIHTWTNGVFVPTFIQSPGALGPGLAGPQRSTDSVDLDVER